MDKKQRSASLHDIMDSETFLGPSVVPHQGVDNPLTAIGMFSDFSGSDGDGTERASDVDMEEGRVRDRDTQKTTHLIYVLVVYCLLLVIQCTKAVVLVPTYNQP